MYEKLEVCPVCKHTSFTNFLICTDFSITGESFALNQCKKCTLVFTNPRPSEQALPDYYKHPNYISHQNKSTTPKRIKRDTEMMIPSMDLNPILMLISKGEKRENSMILLIDQDPVTKMILRKEKNATQ